MGLVSCSEDNEELLLHHQQICSAIDRIHVMLDRTAIENPNTVEKQIRRFVERMQGELQNVRKQVDLAFADAQRILRDPNVRIVKKLQKESAAKTRAKSQLSLNQKVLATTQQKNARLTQDLQKMQKQMGKLQSEVAWRSAVEDVKPIRPKKNNVAR